MQLVLAVFLSLAVAAPALSAEAAGRREGRFFVVIAPDVPEAVLIQAVETADAAWPFIREIFEAPRNGYPEKPVIRLHRDLAAYESAEYALTHGRFKANLAFSSWQTWESHIALQPYLSDEALSRFGLPGLTRQQIAHEATHIVSYRVFPCYQQLPLWLSEGAACYIARRTLIALGFADHRGSDPESSKDVLLARSMLASGRAPALSAYLAGQELSGERLEVYAFQGMVFEFLMAPATGSSFRAALRKVGRLPEKGTTAEQISEIVCDALTRRRLDDLDPALRGFLDQFTPAWDMPYRSLDVRAEGWYVGTMDKNAIAWRRESLPSRYRIGGRVTCFPGEAAQLNLLLARRDEGFLQLGFRPDSLILLEFRAGVGDNWTTLARAPADAIAAGHEVAFTVAAGERELTIELNGDVVLRHPLEGRDLSGPFGVGAIRGSAGVWRDLRVEALD